MYWRPVPAWPIQMREPRLAARSHYSKPYCRNCPKWTVSMPVSKMAPGCRCGALANSTMNSSGRATAGANIAINLVRPTPSGELPMRRIFEDRQGDEVGQLDLWKYGYDARQRPWYRETMKVDRPLVSSPYLAFS